MYTKSQLARIIKDQHEHYKLPSDYIERDIEPLLVSKDTEYITILTGIRRAGKSTLLLRIMQKKGGNYYVNFDDERLAEFTFQDFQTLYEVLLELYGEQDYFYFDEIQNVKGWERFVRRLHDWNKRIYLTGSNANLLSYELGTRLTGRYIQYTLFPLSFAEYLRFYKIELGKDNLKYLDTPFRVKILKLFKDYLKEGGFPGYLKELDAGILKLLYENVLYRDIIARFRVSNIDALERLARYSMSNFARYVQFSKLKQFLGVKNTSTVSKYFKYLQGSYLFFLLHKYEYSLKKQYNLPKKLYTIDTGLAGIIGFNFSENIGYALENVVFLHLKRAQVLDPLIEVYYFNDKKVECDFLVKHGNKVVEAIQVTLELTDENMKREVDGLITVLKKFNLRNGTLITLDQEDELKYGDITIRVVPAYLWALENFFVRFF